MRSAPRTCLNCLRASCTALSVTVLRPSPFRIASAFSMRSEAMRRMPSGTVSFRFNSKAIALVPWSESVHIIKWYSVECRATSRINVIFTDAGTGFVSQDPMDRIVIIGCSAGGKSTIARELSQILGIDVIHLDKVLWKPGCRLSEPHEEPEALRELLDRPRWIMDGNYTASLAKRLSNADTVVFIDFSRWRCLARALKRLLQFRGRTRPDMGAKCP